MHARRSAGPGQRLARLLIAVALVAGLHLTGPADRATAQSSSSPPGGVTLTVAGAPEGELAVPPGGTADTRVTVGNPAAYPQQVELEVTGLHVVDGEYRFDGEPTPGLTVIATPSHFTLAAGGRRDVVVVLRAAPDIRPGGAYAGLVVRGLPHAQPGSSPVIGEVALPLVGRVPGPVADTGRIVSFGPEQPRVPRGHVPFAVEFEATGGVHLTPLGTVELFEGDRSLGLVDVEHLAVLPGTTRTLHATWTGETPVGTLRARLDLRWGLSGQYHETREATVEIVPAGAVAAPAGGSRGNGRAGAPGKDDNRSGLLLLLLLGLGLALLLFLLVLAALLLAREQRRKRQEQAARDEHLPRLPTESEARAA